MQKGKLKMVFEQFFKRINGKIDNVNDDNREVIIDMEKINLTKKQVENLKEFVVVDIETTGLKPEVEEIIEIGAVYFKNGEIVSTFDRLIKPTKKIPASAKKVNNITDSMVANELSEKEVIKLFDNYINEISKRSVLFCAHNASFDFSFLDTAFNRSGVSTSLKYFDTLQIARKYVKEVENHKQPTLAEYFEIKNLATHRACADAECCGKILLKIIESVKVK